MNKTKFITIVAIGLLIANLVLCFFLVMGKLHPHPIGQSPKNIIVKTLHFDKTQVKAYDKIIETHQTAINAAQGKIQKQKKALYQTLANEATEAKKDSLIKEIGLTYLAIENANYQHFTAIKAICKPEQIADFATLMDKIAEVFNDNKKLKKPR